MKTGLVFGKFMPLHKGHLSLIEFALKNCNKLYVILCYCSEEPIAGQLREIWLKESLAKNKNVTIVPFEYDSEKLPNSSVSSKVTSKIWAAVFKKMIPDVNIVFSSEHYGNYVAEYMSIEHKSFDIQRNKISVSASAIRSNPFHYWDFIADKAKHYFVKKIAILGTESTGKSTLAENLARHYKTLFIPEVGRTIVEKTDECKIEDLYRISELHAKKIQNNILKANKLLFIDTDLNITKSYSNYLFSHQLKVEDWIEKANQSDLYLFLENDACYIQDGTRLSKKQRDILNSVHKKILKENGINYILINGNWNERFHKTCKIINEKYFLVNE